VTGFLLPLPFLPIGTAASNRLPPFAFARHGSPLHLAVSTIHQGLGVAAITAWRDMLASDPGIERVMAPFNFTVFHYQNSCLLIGLRHMPPNLLYKYRFCIMGEPASRPTRSNFLFGQRLLITAPEWQSPCETQQVVIAQDIG